MNPMSNLTIKGKMLVMSILQVITIMYFAGSATIDHLKFQSDIEKTRMAYESAYKRMVGGFELKVNKTAKIAGQKWAQLEFISNTIDSKVYNIFLITGYKKQMLIFNFNSTLKEFEKYEKKFRKSIKSITLKLSN